ncbi:methionyl-tRNA formyltransferase, mitochondrial [Caerostris extrusa]|uniref:methionyl-tRNA formyltransferase n=1 Tax=Caerostris extrusa TaxID=172846 RepID=A0AAV4V6D2_CAEEX|nr:methionyl-tRNA formyltransferase, mitochondrial [Caerostris extrusa]
MYYQFLHSTDVKQIGNLFMGNNIHIGIRFVSNEKRLERIILLDIRTQKKLSIDISQTCDKIVGKVDVICINSDCPVRRCATRNNLTIYTWPHTVPDNIYDVGVVVSFGHMIPAENILACKYGIINAHPSLLPRWRGAAPIVHTILNGDSETGVTITQVSPNKFDVGNILMQEKYKIPVECSAQTLTSELSKVAADLVMKTLKNLPSSIKSGYPQPKEGATFMLVKLNHIKVILIGKDTNLLIYRKFKAFDGFFDLYTFWQSMKVILLEFVAISDVEKANVSSLIKFPVHPGFCYFHKKRKILFVKCQDGWCGILSIKIPKKGKKLRLRTFTMALYPKWKRMSVIFIQMIIKLFLLNDIDS